MYNNNNNNSNQLHNSNLQASRSAVDALLKDLGAEPLFSSINDPPPSFPTPLNGPNNNYKPSPVSYNTAQTDQNAFSDAFVSLLQRINQQNSQNTNVRNIQNSQNSQNSQMFGPEIQQSYNSNQFNQSNQIGLPNPISILNEMHQRYKKSNIPPKYSFTIDSTTGNFYCQLEVFGKIFRTERPTLRKQQAKEEAALIALRNLVNESDSSGNKRFGGSDIMKLYEPSFDNRPNNICKSEIWYRKQLNDFPGKQPRVILLEFCQMHRLPSPTYRPCNDPSGNTYFECSVGNKHFKSDRSFIKSSEAKDYVARIAFDVIYREICEEERRSNDVGHVDARSSLLNFIENHATPTPNPSSNFNSSNFNNNSHLNINSSYLNFNNQQSNLHSSINNSHSNVINPLSSINNPVSSINHSLSSINNPLTSINHSLSSINNPLTSINHSLSSINNPLSSINNSLSSINSPLSNTNSPLSSINSPLSSINNSHSTINNPLSSVINPQSSINNLHSSVSNSHLNISNPHSSISNSHLMSGSQSNNSSPLMNINSTHSNMSSPLMNSSHLNISGPYSNLSISSPHSNSNVSSSHLNEITSSLVLPNFNHEVHNIKIEEANSLSPSNISESSVIKTEEGNINYFTRDQQQSNPSSTISYHPYRAPGRERFPQSPGLNNNNNNNNSNQFTKKNAGFCKKFTSLLYEMAQSKRWSPPEFNYENGINGFVCLCSVQDYLFRGKACSRKMDAKESAAEEAYRFLTRIN